jgi:hypothetical protein
MGQPVKGEGEILSVFSLTILTSGATAVSDPIDVSDQGYFGIWYTVASTGTAHARIYVEESYDNTSSNFVYPTGVSDIESDKGAGTVVKSIAPVPMRFIRFRATALSTSDPNVTLSVRFFKQS